MPPKFNKKKAVTFTLVSRPLDATYDPEAPKYLLRPNKVPVGATWEQVMPGDFPTDLIVGNEPVDANYERNYIVGGAAAAAALDRAADAHKSARQRRHEAAEDKLFEKRGKAKFGGWYGSRRADEAGEDVTDATREAAAAEADAWEGDEGDDWWGEGDEDEDGDWGDDEEEEEEEEEEVATGGEDRYGRRRLTAAEARQNKQLFTYGYDYNKHFRPIEGLGTFLGVDGDRDDPERGQAVVPALAPSHDAELEEARARGQLFPVAPVETTMVSAASGLALPVVQPGKGVVITSDFLEALDYDAPGFLDLEDDFFALAMKEPEEVDKIIAQRKAEKKKQRAAQGAAKKLVRRAGYVEETAADVDSDEDAARWEPGVVLEDEDEDDEDDDGSGLRPDFDADDVDAFAESLDNDDERYSYDPSAYLRESTVQYYRDAARAVKASNTPLVIPATADDERARILAEKARLIALMQEYDDAEDEDEDEDGMDADEAMRLGDRSEFGRESLVEGGVEFADVATVYAEELSEARKAAAVSSAGFGGRKVKHTPMDAAEREDVKRALKKTLARIDAEAAALPSMEDVNRQLDLEYKPKREAERFDVESICSTYSNSENIPALIREQRAHGPKGGKIKLSSKLGVPVGVMEAHRQQRRAENEAREKKRKAAAVEAAKAAADAASAEAVAAKQQADAAQAASDAQGSKQARKKGLSAGNMIVEVGATRSAERSAAARAERLRAKAEQLAAALAAMEAEDAATAAAAGGGKGGNDDEEEQEQDEDEDDDDDEHDLQVTAKRNKGAKRDKNETPEQRKARKAAVKAEQAAARVRKRESKDMFKKEALTQNKMQTKNVLGRASVKRLF